MLTGPKITDKNNPSRAHLQIKKTNPQRQPSAKTKKAVKEITSGIKTVYLCTFIVFFLESLSQISLDFLVLSAHSKKRLSDQYIFIHLSSPLSLSLCVLSVIDIFFRCWCDDSIPPKENIKVCLII